MSALERLSQTGDQLTVPGLLAVALVVIVLGLYRQLFVPGWLYRECLKDRDKAESEVAQMAARNEEKIARLELQVEQLRAPRGRAT